MLAQNDLTAALTDALRAAKPACGCFCTASIAVDGEQFVVAHNGTGNRDTNVQRVFAPAVLTMNAADLVICLKAWVEGLHTGKRLDLNAGKS